jgi:radical SAM superfamily enzyme YgiQ (UPF0313 family)
VASEAEKAGYEVKIFDGLWDDRLINTSNNNHSLSNILDDFQPDIIGVSVRNIDDVVMENSIYYIDEIERLCIEPIKKYGRGICILGGSGYSLFPKELLLRWEFDYGIVGPGEDTFVKLLNILNNGGVIEKVPGLIFRENDHSIRGNPKLNLPSKRSSLHLPFPEIDQRLNYEPYRSRSSYPIQTKRGCALKCLYCSYPTLEGKTYQLRSAVEVVNEMESVLMRIPNMVFEFVDSTFNHPTGHAENICREIIKRNIKVSLRTMGVNPSGITPQLIELMQHAGFTQIDCTPDSASDNMLKQLRKGFTRKKLEQVAQIIKEADMPTMWFFLLGGPGENEETIDETFDFIRRFIDEKDMVHITEGLRIYPKTGLADIARKEGLINKNESLLKPHFYISSQLGKDKLTSKVLEFTGKHHNCIRSIDSSPSKEMIQEAILLRQEQNLMDEPMFRTLLRVRKKRFRE